MTASWGAGYCHCGRAARGLVDAEVVDGVEVYAHVCRQCSEHCELARYVRQPNPPISCVPFLTPRQALSQNAT